MPEAPQYSLMLCEAETGVILNRCGAPKGLNDPSEVGIYASESDARKDAEALLLELAWADATILLGDDRIERIVSPLFDDYAAERTQYFAWLKIPAMFRWIRQRPSTPLLAQQAAAPQLDPHRESKVLS